MSTPINEPSRTTIADGKVRFILFRRDLVGNAPERIDVRVVARVVRALKFDAKGKPNFTAVSGLMEHSQHLARDEGAPRSG